MLRAAPYVRVSTDEQVQGYSIEGQLETIRTYANERSYRIPAEYVDPGFQSDTADRPALKRLLADARTRAFDAILVWRFDRIFRDLRLFLNVEHELRQYGVRIISVTEAVDDTHEGRLQLLIKGSFAEYEKAVILQRSALGSARAAREGKWMGGAPPYGYSLDPTTSRLVTNEHEAQWVRKIFTWFVEEELSLEQLMRRVNQLHIPTRWDTLKLARRTTPAGWWHRRTIHRLLTRELYAGTFHYRKTSKPRTKPRMIRPQEDWIPVPIPPIIDDRLFRLAQDRLKKNAIFSRRRTHRPYLLRGLLHCGSCGRRWTGRPAWWKDTTYYMCSGRLPHVSPTPCKRSTINGIKLETLVWNTLVQLLQDPRVVMDRLRRRLDQEGQIPQKQERLRSLRAEIEAANHEAGRLVYAYKQEVIDLDTLQSQRAETEDRIRALGAERDELTGELEGWLNQDAQAVTLERLSRELSDGLSGLPFERRVHLVRQLIDKIIVNETAIEIHTILKCDSQSPPLTLCDEKGADGHATLDQFSPHESYLGPHDNVLRLTLYADLPQPARHARAANRTAA